MVEKTNTKVFKGYHGTKASLGAKILSEGIRTSKQGWLGEGIYFFDDDIEKAIMWAKYKCKRNSEKTFVLVSHLEVSIDKLLDVSDPRSESNKKFQAFRDAFLLRASKVGSPIDIKKEELDNKLLNMITKKDNYELVRNFTHTYTGIDRNMGRIGSNVPNTIELCVKNKDVIKSLEGVDLNE